MKCLPLALLRIKMAPCKIIRISPYKMLYRLPYLGWPSDLSSFKTKDQFLIRRKLIICLVSLLPYHLSGNKVCWLK
jgi:hypothetical protein